MMENYKRTIGYADEIDIVLPLFLIADLDWSLLGSWCESVRREIKKPLKGIIEIGYWSKWQVENICEILIDNRWDFVKTCTGFGPRGVTVEDIKLLKEGCKDRIKIKASGGIKTKDFANALIKAGANRIGTSSDLISK